MGNVVFSMSGGLITDKKNYKSQYQTPFSTGSFGVISSKEFFQDYLGAERYDDLVSSTYDNFYNKLVEITITNYVGNIIANKYIQYKDSTQEYWLYNNGNEETLLGVFGAFNYNVCYIPAFEIEISETDIYNLQYKIYSAQPSSDGPYIIANGVLGAVQNKYPLKKWTVTDVVNRCLELIEPLRGNENPRYRFNGVNYDIGVAQKPYTVGSQAEKYDKVLAPEFAMTKQTVR